MGLDGLHVLIGRGHHSTVSIAVECVWVARSCDVPLRGLGSGLAASGLTGVRTYRSSAGAGCSGVRAMACTNRRCGWPGYRWGRGPDWTTTGVIRPITEIQGSVAVAVDDLARGRADQVFVDATLPFRRHGAPSGRV